MIGLNSITVPPVALAILRAFSLSRVRHASLRLTLHRRSAEYRIVPTRYSPFFRMIRLPRYSLVKSAEDASSSSLVSEMLTSSEPLPTSVGVTVIV